MVGYTADELIGLNPPMPYWAPEDLERTQRLHDEILAGRPAASGHEFAYGIATVRGSTCLSSMSR